MTDKLKIAEQALLIIYNINHPQSAKVAKEALAAIQENNSISPHKTIQGLKDILEQKTITAETWKHTLNNAIALLMQEGE